MAIIVPGGELVRKEQQMALDTMRAKEAAMSAEHAADRAPQTLTGISVGAMGMADMGATMSRPLPYGGPMGQRMGQPMPRMAPDSPLGAVSRPRGLPPYQGASKPLWEPVERPERRMARMSRPVPMRMG